MKKWRLYLDTSVFGGVFEVNEGRDAASRAVLDAALSGKAMVCFSETVVKELAGAPEQVRLLIESLPAECREEIAIDEEIRGLSRAYLAAGVVSEKWSDDTLHVAAATVARADAIVSWNFKHMVRVDKIRTYNAINIAEGYAMIQIVSPKEVNFDE
jgi:predicted nucleic acid-binding protein